jgi:hypothetical protein
VRKEDSEELETLTEDDKKLIILIIRLNEIDSCETLETLNSEYNFSKELHDEFNKDKIVFPKSKIKIMILSYIFVVIISLLKGSSHTPSLINIER